MIEAYQRDLWTPEEGLIEDLQDTYLELESWMEESMGEDIGDFQGGAIDIIDVNDIQLLQKNIHGMKENLKNSKGKGQ